MMVYFTSTHFLAGIIALAIVLVILWKKDKSFSYLLFFAIFWIYLMGVVSVVVFPFPIVDPYPDFKPSINLIPFDSRFCDPRILPLCIRNLYENILLTIPFGFGINFIARIKSKNIFWLAIAVGFTFEFIQLIISLIIRNSFRVVDINDAMLNATGVLLGYGFFLAFGKLYIFVIDKFDIQHKFVFAYVYDVINQSR